MSIERAPLPQQSSLYREWFKIISPYRTSPLKFICLSDDIFGVWTHFDRDVGRTLPCRGRELCTYCQYGIIRRWKGYVGAMLFSTSEIRVAEVTEGAARSIELHPLREKGLRGLCIQLQRKRSHATAPVFAELAPPMEGLILPDNPDIEQCLERLWSERTRRANDSNVSTK